MTFVSMRSAPPHRVNSCLYADPFEYLDFALRKFNSLTDAFTQRVSAINTIVCLSRLTTPVTYANYLFSVDFQRQARQRIVAKCLIEEGRESL